MSAGSDLSQAQFAAIARALSDPRRFCILREVAQAADVLPCCALTQSAEVSPPTISHHIRELENAGLVTITREGKFAHLRFQRDVFASYLAMLGRLAPGR